MYTTSGNRLGPKLNSNIHYKFYTIIQWSPLIVFAGYDYQPVIVANFSPLTVFEFSVIVVRNNHIGNRNYTTIRKM